MQGRPYFDKTNEELEALRIGWSSEINMMRASVAHMAQQLADIKTEFEARQIEAKPSENDSTE